MKQSRYLSNDNRLLDNIQVLIKQTRTLDVYEKLEKYKSLQKSLAKQA